MKASYPGQSGSVLVKELLPTLTNSLGVFPLRQELQWVV